MVTTSWRCLMVVSRFNGDIGKVREQLRLLSHPRLDGFEQICSQLQVTHMRSQVMRNDMGKVVQIADCAFRSDQWIFEALVHVAFSHHQCSGRPREYQQFRPFHPSTEYRSARAQKTSPVIGNHFDFSIEMELLEHNQKRVLSRVEHALRHKTCIRSSAYGTNVNGHS